MKGKIDVENMSAGEKIKAIETLWGSLLGEDLEPDSPDWHGEILEKRKKMIDSGEATFISLDKLRDYYKK